MTTLERQLRLITGLILAAYVIPHVINHALAIVSFEWLESMREPLSVFWDLTLFKSLLSFSLLTHFALALWRLYQRRNLKMPAWEAVQLGFGLLLVPLLAGHVIGTRVAAEIGGLDPDYLYVLSAVTLSPRYQVQMPLLLLITWVHLAFGLHFWLRLNEFYRRTFPLWVVLSIALPVLALAGLTRGVVSIKEYVDDADFLADAFAGWQAMDESARQIISSLESWVVAISLLLVVAVLLARFVRDFLSRRNSEVKIEHANGRMIRAKRGQTLLEAVRTAGIPHASVCGGRGRCTTCRVRVGVGRDKLDMPAEMERSALMRIGADETVRLACQLRLGSDIAVTPLLNPANSVEKNLKTESLQGTEQEVVCMFVDMRGSTQMGERILPYDVVYILNQFFNELAVSLAETHGHYAQFAGDGLMAMYGLSDRGIKNGAREALTGADEMFKRLARLNQRIAPEFDIKIRMGIGIHSGPAIVGRMGPPQSPILTAIGDNINIAARLESSTKTEGCDLIVSESTLIASGYDFAMAERATLKIRGREQGIAVGKFNSADLDEMLKHNRRSAAA